MTTYAGMNAPVAVKILLAVMTSLLFLVRFSQSIISNKTSEKMMYFNLMTRRENSLTGVLDGAYTHFAYICVPEDCVYTREDTSLLGSEFVAHRLNEKGRKYFQEKYSKILTGVDINHCDYALRPVNKNVILNDAIYKIGSIISSCENLAVMIDDTKEIDESIAALRKCIKKLVEQKHKIQ